MDEFIENLQVGISMQEFFKGQVQSCPDDLFGGTSTFANPFNGYLTFLKDVPFWWRFDASEFTNLHALNDEPPYNIKKETILIPLSVLIDLD